MNLNIKPLENMKEAEEVVQLQKMAWEMDDIGAVPTFETRAVADAGFVYVGKIEDKVISFIYGYHHFPNIHYSHMMAVLPEYQGHNIGYKMKQYHRLQAIQSEHFVRAVQWTVDPLLPNNAYLNFSKLGAYCDIYKINYYGDPSSDGVGIYAGVPTDRFKITWPIHSQRVERRMKDYKIDFTEISELHQRSPPINKIENNQYEKITKNWNNSFSVEVPANYQDIRNDQIEFAIDWRMKFREICVEAIERNFIVVDYHSYKNESKRRNFYEFIPRSDFADLS